jgi:hypothetical protein
MSITYANFRAIFNRKIGDVPIAFTSTAGSTTTATSTTLREYYTSSGGLDLFHDWWCYSPSDTVAARQERRIEAFDPETGKLKFYAPFGATVATASLEIHRWQVSKKLLIINDALEYGFKDGWYNPTYNETLWGQESYGEEPDEFNKRAYTVPTTFEEFPEQILLFDAYTGTHTGSDNEATVLTDSSASWEINELVGQTIYNKTDGSSGEVQSNTSTTVTVTALSGGTDDDWDEDDEYIVQKPQSRPIPLYDYDVPDKTGGAFVFYARIPENYLIKLVGKGTLTNFSTEASTTELYDHDARILAEKAAHLWYEYLADSSFGQDVEGAREKAMRHLALYEQAKRGRAMPEIQKLKMDRRWLGW